MTLRNSLTFSLVLVLSACGIEMRNSPSALHWLRSLDPNTDCSVQPAGTNVGDPDNCKNYYVCDANHKPAGPYTCDKCYIAGDPDPLKGDCSDDQNQCDVKCNMCLKTCTKTGDLIVDPDDSGKYYICLGAAAGTFDLVDQYCPPVHPYFNGETCVDEEAQCCKCQVPICAADDGGKQFADPQDCHSYYMCVQFGSGLMKVHNTCEDGGSYVNGQCDPNTKECSNICGGDVPTTTIAPGCTELDDFTCLDDGHYAEARCPYCDPSYFSCNKHVPTIVHCPGSLVFNTDPAYRFCLKPENCPSPPPQPFNL